MNLNDWVSHKADVRKNSKIIEDSIEFGGHPDLNKQIKML